MSRALLHREDGVVGGLEALPFGVLVFVVGTLLVGNAWGLVDAKLATGAAAREAARAYVEATSAEAAATAARAAAAAALTAHGRDAAKMRVSQEGGAPFARCVRVAFEVAYPVPAVVLPWIGGYGEGFTARSRHSEIVDPLRSGLTGEADCVR
jgi:hypothetical protein